MAKQLHRRLNKIKNSDTSMFALAADILSQSLEVLQTVRDINPDIKNWPKMKRGQAYMLSISEMLFLIMHFVNRAIYQIMPQPARLEFMDRLGATVAEGLAHYLKVPTHGQERDQFEVEFFKALNDREMEYGHCKAIFKEENLTNDDVVVYRGVVNLLGVVYPGDQPLEKSHILAVIKTIDTIFSKLKLDKHLSEFK